MSNYPKSTLSNYPQTKQNNSSQPSPSCPLTKLQKNYHSEQLLKEPSMIKKILTKIENKESNFQIFRPKGDLQLPRDGESNDKLTKEDQKLKMYQKMIKPLKGMCFYSSTTLQMKLEMDLMISEYFDMNDVIENDNL